LARFQESVLHSDVPEITRMQTENRNLQHEVDSLLERVIKGDREAFMHLTQLYQKKIFQLAYSYFHNKEDALDIVQETFLRLYQKAHMFRPGNNFQSWLLSLSKNICIDYYRKHRKKDNEFRRDEDIEGTSHSSPDFSHHDPSSDLKDVFSRCLEKLSEKQRMIFVMKHYNQLHYREIAQVLDIAQGTVKSLHFKAVRNLRTLMSPYLGRMG
jgi:RNA polymerase sigma-70 factor (ECF subfamily)